MNRLILLGNGFDLAHGLKTRYEDFIFNLLQKTTAEILRGEKQGRIVNTGSREYNRIINFYGYHKDILLSIEYDHNYDEALRVFKQINDLESLLNFYKNHNGIRLSYSSKLFSETISKCQQLGWVDLELEYFQNLKLGRV